MKTLEPVRHSDRLGALALDLSRVVLSLGGMPDRFIGDTEYFHIWMTTGRVPSDFPVDVLAACGLVNVGGRISPACTHGEIVEHEVLIVGGRQGSARRLAEMIGTDKQEVATEEAIRCLEVVESVRIPSRAEIVSEKMQGDAAYGWLEAVVHPYPNENGTSYAVAPDTVIQQWAALVESWEGEVCAEYIRKSGCLTFIPTKINPAAIGDVFPFNALRLLRPMPSMNFRG